MNMLIFSSLPHKRSHSLYGFLETSVFSLPDDDPLSEDLENCSPDPFYPHPTKDVRVRIADREP